MRYVIDSNVLIHLANKARGYRTILRHISRHEKKDMGISAISAVELFRMIAARKVSAENIARLESHLKTVQVFPFSKKAAETFARLELAMKHQPIGEKDLLIAAHAIAMDAVCVTDNTEEFKRVPGLRLVNWRKAR